MPGRASVLERAFEIIGLLGILYCVFALGFIVYMVMAHGGL